MKNIKKLNITNKITPIIASGVLFLTGCGQIQKENVETDVINASSISSEEAITTTTNTSVTTKDVKSTTTTTSTTEVKSSDLVTTTTASTTTLPHTTTTTTTYVKHPGEAGFNEFNNHLTDIMGEYNSYSYVDGYEEYVCLKGDTLKSVAEKFNTTIGNIIEINHLTSDELTDGQKIKYSVKDEFINVPCGTDVTGIAVAHGINEDEVLALNDIPAYNTVIGRDAAIKLHRYVGFEDSYQTGIGTVNVIYNNRILGEDVEYAHGFMGSSQRALVKNSILNGTSTATFYCFDGANNIIEENTICSNPKRIDVINGIPVAFVRTREDLEELASAYGVELDELAIMQWGSVNNNNYFVHVTEDDEQFITFDGRIIEGYKMISAISYEKDNDGNVIDATNKQLIK